MFLLIQNCNSDVIKSFTDSLSLILLTIKFSQNYYFKMFMVENWLEANQNHVFKLVSFIYNSFVFFVCCIQRLAGEIPCFSIFFIPKLHYISLISLIIRVIKDINRPFYFFVSYFKHKLIWKNFVLKKIKLKFIKILLKSLFNDVLFCDVINFLTNYTLLKTV